MPVHRAGRQDLAVTRTRRHGPVYYGRSMVSVAVLPRRYYLVPMSIDALYFTVTAVPRLIDRHDHRTGASRQPGRRPLVVTAAVLALAGRGLLRATGAGSRRTRAPGR